MTIEILVLISGLILLAMVISLALRKQPDYGKGTRAGGMEYERYKITNGNGRL